jgi:hypothetical protein
MFFYYLAIPYIALVLYNRRRSSLLRSRSYHKPDKILRSSSLTVLRMPLYCGHGHIKNLTKMTRIKRPSIPKKALDEGRVSRSAHVARHLPQAPDLGNIQRHYCVPIRHDASTFRNELTFLTSKLFVSVR